MNGENTNSVIQDIKNTTIDPVDKKVLDHLLELMKEDFFELIDLFLENVPIQLGMLKGYVKEKDADGIFRSAHTLTSSSSNLGAGPLVALCKGLMEVGCTGKTEGGDEAIKKIEEEFERVKIILESVKLESV